MGGADPFHCAALRPGGPCPIDRGLVDLVVDVRADASALLTPREYGVVCAHRGHVPVVVVGDRMPTVAGSTPTWVLGRCAPDNALETVGAVTRGRGQRALSDVRAAVRAELGRRTGDSRAVVSLDEHADGVDVTVRSATVPSRRTAAALRRTVREALRPYGADGSGVRVVTRALP